MTGMSGGLYLTAFSTMLATARSSRPRSTSIMGRLSGMSSSTLPSGTPPRSHRDDFVQVGLPQQGCDWCRSGGGTCRAGCPRGGRAGRRLPRSRRVVPPGPPATIRRRRSAVSGDGCLDGGEGVRRSWLTAASRAVRILLPSASLRATSASPTSRCRSRTTAACAANAPSTRRSSAGSTRPVRARARWSPTGIADVGVLRPLRVGAVGAHPAAHVHGPPSPARSSSATESIWNVSRTRSSSASSVVSPRSTLPARSDSVSRLRPQPGRRCVRRAARPTTEATDTATAKNTTIVTMFSGLAMAQVRKGGVKNQCSSSERLPSPRPAPATARRSERRGDGQAQEQQHLAGDARPVARQRRAAGSAGTGRSRRPATSGDDAVAGEPRAPAAGYSRPLRRDRKVVGDDVDVQVGVGAAR